MQDNRTPEEHVRLSVVVVARNDHHRDNFQNFVNALQAQWAKHRLDAELIVVEWNPPDNVPRLRDAVRWPSSTKPRPVRIIPVPNEYHRRLPNADRILIFEGVAKNVGIRRAKGEYVLCTNADELHSSRLAKFLASGSLREDAFYRVDRFDVVGKVPLQATLAQQLRYCEKNSGRLHTLGTTVDLTRGTPFPVARWLARRKAARVRSAQAKIKVRVEDRLHTNASGSFMLMHRDAWWALRGYPELYARRHIDSYMCCIASSYALRQIVLDGGMCLFHQDHRREGFSNAPVISYELWSQDCEQMLRDKKPSITNSADWGWGNETFQEMDIFEG